MICKNTFDINSTKFQYWMQRKATK